MYRLKTMLIVMKILRCVHELGKWKNNNVSREVLFKAVCRYLFNTNAAQTSNDA